MRLLATPILVALSVVAMILRAQAPVQKLEKICSVDDIEFFGLACSEDDPCPVFLELVGVEANGSSLFLTGNLHTVSTTLAGLLLQSDDIGKTWTEPAKRIRSAELEQIQFADFQHGWIGGVKLEPLPQDPFFLTTSDGGKTWKQTPIFDEPHFGSIFQFWFESATNGQLIVDASQGQTKRYEVYETRSGGKSPSEWDPKEVSDREMRIAAARPREYANWRVRADSQAYRIERRTAANADSWETVASFAIQPGECK